MERGFGSIPQHVAIIMDGNGRWAKKRFLPRVAGHKQGAQVIKEIVEKAIELDIKVITLFAFSTENWGRPKDEVNFLMNLPEQFFKDYLPKLVRGNVQLRTIGNIQALPDKTKAIINDALSQTCNNTGLILNFAINYGSRHEILMATQSLARKAKDGEVDPETLIEEDIGKELMTHFLGDLSQPDLIIRTSGEQRLSNFLLWQAAYSEFYFTDTLWPDFDGRALEVAVEDYSKRQRRYGKL